MESKNDIAVVQPTAIMRPSNPFELDVQRVVAMRQSMVKIVDQVMKEKIHYGQMPGVKAREGEPPKMVLFQPGADVLCQVFRLSPKFEIITRREEADFIAIEVMCRLVNINTGEIWGESPGSANSREDRYLNQSSQKLCPECGKPAIFKSKNKGEGWFCWKKKDGCGATFSEDDKAILDQSGAINPNKVWNLHNTILKIACKRAKVGATLTATGAAEIFTQDIVDDPDENMGDEHAGGKSTPVRASDQPAAGPAKATPVQIRDLQMALNELELGHAAAADMKGLEREGVIRTARLAWVNGMLTSHDEKPVSSSTELTADLAAKLIAAARAGEMPPTEKK
jgi:hypothetical protein